MPALPPKTSRIGDLHLRGLMVNPVLLCIGLRERQEHVGLGHVGTDVTGIVGGGGGGWNQVLSYRTGQVLKRGLWEGGCLGWNENGELFYGIDTVMDGLGGRIANEF